VDQEDQVDPGRQAPKGPIADLEENQIARPLPLAHEVPNLNVPDHEAVNEGAIV
jgi:hypothetical protein